MVKKYLEMRRKCWRAPVKLLSTGVDSQCACHEAAASVSEAALLEQSAEPMKHENMLHAHISLALSFFIYAYIAFG